MFMDQNPGACYSQVFLSPSGDVPPAEVYASRRWSLLQKINSIGIFCGVPRDPGSEEVFFSTWTKFVQDPAFLFLTGINQAGCLLILNPFAKTPDEREILFLPPKDVSKEFWFGKRLGYSDDLAEVKALTGFKTVLPASEFWNYLLTILKFQKTDFVYAFYLEFLSEGKTKKISDDHNALFAAELRKRLTPLAVSLKTLAEPHFDLRVVLDPLRIENSRTAQLWTGNAFKETLSHLKTFKNERELGLFLDYQMQIQSDGDLAFPTIVAGGRNACCLHYVKKDEPLRPGDLVLLDFGVRSGTQHSDISRTIPVNGKFDPLQRLLYGLVLDAQKFHEREVKPGAFLLDLDRNVWNFIWDELQRRFVSKGGAFKLFYDKRPHGVSHLIGEQIHEGDPFRCYMAKPLQAGMLISNEPGLYGYFEIVIDGVRYAENIGIRIEDDLLLTPSGCENISKDIPREPDELESLITKEFYK